MISPKIKLSNLFIFEPQFIYPPSINIIDKATMMRFKQYFPICCDQDIVNFSELINAKTLLKDLISANPDIEDHLVTFLLTNDTCDLTQQT